MAIIADAALLSVRYLELYPDRVGELKSEAVQCLPSVMKVLCELPNYSRGVKLLYKGNFEVRYTASNNKF